MTRQLESNQRKTEEILAITSVRGLASFWVLLFHLSGILRQILPELSFANPLILQGHLAVPFFFILSGYILALRYRLTIKTVPRRHLFKFWGLRLGRIYPVHLLTLLVSLLLVARRGWPSGPGHSPQVFIANLLLVHAWSPTFNLSWNYPAWSVSSEWFAYLLCPWLFVFLQTAKEKVVRLWLLLAFLAAILTQVMEYTFFRGLLVVIPTFSGGAFMATLHSNLKEKKPSRIRLGFPLLFSFFLIPFCFSDNSLVTALYVVFSFVLVAELGKQPRRDFGALRSKTLVYLGDISYSLYLTHAITITLLTRFFPFEKFMKADLLIRLLLSLGTLAAILSVASIVFHSFEKPIRDGIRRRLA